MTHDGMTFAGERKPYVSVLSVDIDRAASIRRKYATSPGLAGGKSQGYETEVREIQAVIDFSADSREEWIDRAAEVMGWLIRDEPAELTFDSEPGRVFMAEFTGKPKSYELNIYGQLTLDFICTDPYAYGAQTVATFSDGVAQVTNNGTVDALPLVSAVATAPITYVDVWNDQAYMRVGQPADFTQTSYEPTTKVLDDELGTTQGWSISQTNLDGGEYGGEIKSNGYSFRPDSFGTGVQWHGPALKRSVPEAPIEDFTVEFPIIFLNPTSGVRGRLEWHLLDDQGEWVGKVAMKRVGGGANGNTVEIRLGAQPGRFLLNWAGERGVEWLNFRGVLRLSRVGNVWSYYVARVDPDTGRHTARASDEWVDEGYEYTRNLAQIQIHFAQAGTAPTPTMFANRAVVKRHNPAVAGVPYIAQTDDIIEMDFATGDTFINGEPVDSRRELGASYFGVERGDSALLIAPADQLSDAKVTLRSRYH